MNEEQDKLVWEIQDLQFEIDEYIRSINRRKIILERKEQQLKEMQDTHRNTNEAVENKLKEDNAYWINKLQNHNWNVALKTANYPMLEIVDENTVKIEGVEYKKVAKETPITITLERIITDCMIGYNSSIMMELLENILDRVEVEWLRNKVGRDTEEPIVDIVEYHRGWDNCIEELKTRLRE